MVIEYDKCISSSVAQEQNVIQNMCLNTRVEHFSQWEEMTSLAQATSQLLQHLLTEHQLAIQRRSQILSGLLTLLSKSLVLAKQDSLPSQSDCKAQKFARQEGGLQRDIFKESFNSLRESLEKLLRASGSLQQASQRYCQDEFQFWSNLLSVKLDDDEMQQRLESCVKDVLESRISEIDYQRVMELYCTLDLSIYHQEIGDCLMSAAFKAIDHSRQGEIKDGQMERLSARLDSVKLAEWQTSGVGKLFGHLLMSHWPEGRDGTDPSRDELLRHVFSWKPMEEYFKYFQSSLEMTGIFFLGGQRQDGASLPPKSSDLLELASSLLEDVSTGLRNAEIDVKTLRIVQENREKFLKLNYLRSSTEKNQKETNPMELFLDMRSEELKVFESEREAVLSFVEFCSAVKSVGVNLEEIKEKLKKNITSCRMLDLCHKREITDVPLVKYFELTPRNKRMTQYLHQLQSSHLFRTIWHKCEEKVAPICREDLRLAGVLTLDTVNELLWTKSFERWQTLWERVCSGQISLKEVDERFGKFRNEPTRFDIEIEIALKLLPDEQDSEKVINRRVGQIKQYQKLRGCEEAASAILEFQNAMELEGDFQVLDDFRNQGDIRDDQLEKLSWSLESSKLTDRQASGVGKLFGRFLKKQWPEGRDGGDPSRDELLRHLFSWKPMEEYLKYFNGQRQDGLSLPPEGLGLLHQASSLLEEVSTGLRNAEIDVKTLRLVQKNQQKFLKLNYLRSSSGENQSKVPHEAIKIDRVKENQKETDPMELFLEMRCDELKAFESEKAAVSSFVEFCSALKSVKVNLDEIKEKLKKDITSCRVLDLCHKRGNTEEPLVRYFELTSKNKRMTKYLHQLQSSYLFRTIWHKCEEKVAPICRDDPRLAGILTLDAVNELLWTQSFERWQTLWDRVCSGQISLREVDERFDKFRNESERFDIEIGIALKLLPDEQDSEAAINQRVDQIKQYQKLRGCEEAAAAILEFQNAMQLEGDFQVLDDFRNQMSDDFRGRPLSTIGDDVLEMGKDLEHVTAVMIKCLKTVAACKDYIYWLREEVKGRDEVKTLVDLAMMSAGETDIETDRVSCVHTTALGFAPFIFDLDKDTSFGELIRTCESVWKEIEKDTSLLEKLKSISRHLDWLKGVKDEHAMSSLKLAQAINEKGVYSIGKLQDSPASTQLYDKKNVDSVISLLLPPNDQSGKPKEFSLEKLQDLQSKLALISGKDSQRGQEDINKFGELLQGAVQLGQAYVNLCEIGDVSRLHWNEEYKCKSSMGKRIIDEIRLKSEEFEELYDACREHINEMRMKYRELNFFTIRQLLFLRKELASLKQGSKLESLNLQVYSLLEKVLPGLHRKLLKEALGEAGIWEAGFDLEFYGGEDARSTTSQSSQDDTAKDIEQISEKYESLRDNVERFNPSEPERLAVAALCHDIEGSVPELVLWCVRNKDKSDLIDELYEKALEDTRFQGIIGEDLNSDEESSQSSQHTDDQMSLQEGDDEFSHSSPPEETNFNLDETLGGTFLSLDEVGVFLSCLVARNEGRVTTREIQTYLKRGQPNLMLADKENIFAAALELYKDEGMHSLPTSEEVLVCTSETTSEEVELLWRRALASNGEKIHCLVNGDLLDYDVSQKVVDCLFTLLQDYSNPEDFALVVLCSRENEERAHIITCLEQFKVSMPRFPRPEELRRFLAKQFRVPGQRPGVYRERHVIWNPAAEVGRVENLNVLVVSSDHPGVGKSLVVRKLAEELEKLPNNQLVVETMLQEGEETPRLCVTIPFHDKNTHVADAVGFFLPHAISSDIPLSRIFHLDRTCLVTPEFETLLFNLLILGELTDECGRVWRRNSHDLYILEVTNPTSMGPSKAFKFDDLLPQIRCCLPRDTLLSLRRKGAVKENNSPSFDEEELKSDEVQRVWQYLQLIKEEPELIQHFYYNPRSKRTSPAECLKTLIRNCGVENPSWSELRYFVNFLNYQLRDCEENKDTSQIHGASAGSEEEQDIVPFLLRRRWEKSPHPYIFFHPDHDTMTFLGFQVDQEGNLLDPQTQQIIEQRIMSRHLRTGLYVQNVDLENSFESHSKDQKIQSLCRVMGIDFAHDPDDSYELTSDNVKKILAIYMRFRCNIPVIIMGETGCGKTKLIRYLCRLQTEGVEQRNMLLMKIHGGTTYKDIERNVLQAEALAINNRQEGKNINTVLFFDEANTTEALGMIKEIMVDRRCNGRPLNDSLKFIVACNPYRKHTDEMIQKLESAGLGYHVTAAETSERLGKIPLRHLVYRVHAIPESMCSLVWDFGQLNPEVEELYTQQIVRRYVHRGRLPRDENLVSAIGRVLAASQRFMREKKDECSFVSLRDVKRAMDVMMWFHEHFHYFFSLMQEEESESEDDGKNEGEIEFCAQQPNLKEAALASDDERSVLKKEEHAPFKGEGRKLIDHSSRFIPLKEEAIVKRESDEQFPWFTRIHHFAHRKERVVLPEETVRVEDLEPPQVAPRFDPSNTLGFEESVEGLLSEENGDVGDRIDPVTWSLILALGVCYQARLTERKEYREAVAKSFRTPCRLPGGAEKIEREICRCQEALMRELELGPNIACNEALSENVFMMVVCIELRIPLFVVGKPGSSKSLAKSVVADNMQGARSKSKLFKKFRQIQLVSYQCSPQSTPEGILATFKQCSELQESKNRQTTSDTFASVVVLDEVGLAEDSPKMPLKTLHPLLEDDDQNDEFVIQSEKSFTRVAFIGLSNWALDPAKMNRGIMLCRNEPDGDELEATARGICGGDEDIMTHIEHLISPLVSGYKDLYTRQKKLKKLIDGKKDEFFGLRDFYSLIKMIFCIVKEQKRRPNWEELERIIKRNFSGLLEDDFNPVKILMDHVDFPEEYIQNEQRREVDALDLIRASLNRESVMGDGRYLLIMTENFAALPRIKQLLLEQDEEEPYVIFGSGFPKDQLFTQVCRNINRVKMCMETGRTVILLNLENLYESLYDALNQYYVSFGGEKYVDLGLGNNRVKCRVHKDFRLIIIAEKDGVYNKFPIPLINRLEKHFLVMSSGLTELQKELSWELESWVQDFASILHRTYEKQSTFTKGDAFIGYHEDIVPAVVLQVCAELYSNGTSVTDQDRKCWVEEVLSICKERLLQCATPDSVTRLRFSRLSPNADELWKTYFHKQEHSSLANFLEKAANFGADGTSKASFRAQISTHSRLLTDRDISAIAGAVNLHPVSVKCVSLKEIQTEQDFCNRIGRDFWAKLGGRESLLIVQCDSADQNLNLVACSRHLLIEELREMEKELGEMAEDSDEDLTGVSHVLMIIQLPRIKGGCKEFVGVQGEGWLSVHIDELCPPSEEIPPIEALLDRSVSEIFEGALNETEKTENHPTISQVLTSCVQLAASKIEDDESTLERATRRIELLLNLLSSTGQQDDNRFELVVAKRLHVLLVERDQRAPKEGKEWLEDEAKSCTVKETGTFKKALWRRFQSVVAPILAEVIAYIDRDGNLELAASEDPWVSRLWLNIFEDASFSDLSYGMFMSREEDVEKVRSKVPVVKSGYRSHAFQCRFPFSWLLKEQIDEMFQEARSIAENSHETLIECLRRLLDASSVRQIVSEATSKGGDDSVARYLHDFTQMVHKPQDEAETEIVQRAITAAAKELQIRGRSPDDRFAMDFALIHVAHSRIQQRLNCLALFLQVKPDLAEHLCNIFSWEENEMTVDAIALQMCLERMEPYAEELKTTSQRQAWCDSVLSVKIPVEEMIGKRTTEDKMRVGEKTESMLIHCRSMWQRLSAVRLFIEHAYPSQDSTDCGDLQSILNLWKALGEKTDFTKAESLNTVERFLISCAKDSIPRFQESEDLEVQAKFIHRCNAFFMEIVSLFCFGDDVRNLDPDVFEMLMRYVTGTKSAGATRAFSPFPEFGTDSSPVVRSFLLQQLINSSDGKAKKHLQRFLFEAQGLSAEVPHILNVCLLAVQCMENSCASELAMFANFDLPVQIGSINKICQDALRILQEDFTSFDEMQVDSLEAVAKARCSLGMAAHYLYARCVNDDEKWLQRETRGAMEFFFNTVETLCSLGPLGSKSPALFLLKQLVKRYGGHAIVTVSQKPELSWIIPAEFQRNEDAEMNLDRFLVYGELYQELRDSIARAVLSNETNELVASLERLGEVPGQHAKDIILLLALYREIVVPRGTLEQNLLFQPGARSLLKNLLKNPQNVGFPFLTVEETHSEKEKALTDIVFHATSVLRCVEFDELLTPLREIFLAPGQIVNSFLPTMPEDNFQEASSAIKEGGMWGDRSNKGHILGAPKGITVAERDLTPAMVSLMRIILHSAMMAGAQENPEAICQLIRWPDDQPGDVIGFLWAHLANDIDNISASLERSVDEVLLMIHRVLAEIVDRATARGTVFMGKWSTKAERREWENQFSDVFARPVVMNLEELLKNFYVLSINDRRLGSDPLMREIYEVDELSPPRSAAEIHPGHATFWKYRTRLTVEHVIRQFQDIKSNMASCKVLKKFLVEEHRLRAVCHLPNILGLLRILTDRFHRRIDRENAKKLKIREFLQKLPKDQRDNFTKLFQSFCTAWDQVRHHLRSQGRFTPSQEQCSKPIEMTSTVSVLLPTEVGPGVCCKALLFFLVNAHNDMVQAYHGTVGSDESTRSTAKIPLSEVSVSQLVAYDFERDLLPVMLANCSYSLEMGKETSMQYNWEALQKQIVDRFVRGRPTVEFKLDDFVFREDDRGVSFDNLRDKIPQEPIDSQTRTQILSDLKDVRDVSDLLSTLEMAVGFLSKAGGNPETKICDYLKHVLRLSDGKSNLKSKKAQQSCCLGHIMDLWSTLAVVRVKSLLRNGQDPFEKVSEIFKQGMPRPTITRFSAALKKINVDLFLSRVIEVISLMHAHDEDAISEMRLSEYLSMRFDDSTDLDEIRPGDSETPTRIPDEVYVKYVIHAFELAVEVRDRDQGRRRSIMS
ncbi:E3 ubiquitin-protein ligase RNF213 [Stylophora pistillata]|uniref:E3 ubiquitin-protein ligase RNF213 n=1 Tax=Stylophora pistillata TaxID=50429 RepID=A0A2B4RFI5_STYPI|nr:E3 ubiquitin-protein ligase RNF213 [Stylophora pistillata]